MAVDEITSRLGNQLRGVLSDLLVETAPDNIWDEIYMGTQFPLRRVAEHMHEVSKRRCFHDFFFYRKNGG